ncbi:MAG TPA: flagellar basal body rod protein FlgB [Dongiaceae bacterium]|nr:flagellar basal body rod protein FlgB [Dongiaceae bacterium]
MDLFQLKLFQRMSERMGWLGARQEVLAQNIANADTPHFVPHDMKALKFVDHLNQVAPITQARTNTMHLGGTGQPDASIDEQKTKKQYETAPVGNAVVLEEQMVKLADAQSSYQLMTNLYRKHVDLFKMALGRGS